MVIKYNKSKITKDRRIVTSGPADRQRKQALVDMGSFDAALIEDLKEQIAFLKEQLEKKPEVVSGTYTPEQVDEEIVKAVKSETAELRAKNEILSNKNKELLSVHEKEISSLKAIIKNKEEMIQQLRENSNNGMDENKLTSLLAEATKKIEDIAATSQGLSKVDMDADRPKMETVFVDPIESEKDVEAHITTEKVKEESTDKKQILDDKAAQLQRLLGG